MPLRVLSWNLFHGRDHAPDRSLQTWRSRILRFDERNETHIQVNRDLFDEFCALLSVSAWDVALLQESPPRWALDLAPACAAEPHLVLTSRNSLGAIRGLLARMNPDLVASNEGGSNLTLVRRAAGRIAGRRELELRPEHEAERRTMAFTAIELAGGGNVCVANLHASAGRSRRGLAEEEVLLAAGRACEWAEGAPLLFGGDLNLRPGESEVYAELERRHSLVGATDLDGLDHLLSRGLEIAEPPRAWAPERREVPGGGGLAIRLSDHAPVEAAFRLR